MVQRRELDQGRTVSVPRVRLTLFSFAVLDTPVGESRAAAAAAAAAGEGGVSKASERTCFETKCERPARRMEKLSTVLSCANVMW